MSGRFRRSSSSVESGLPRHASTGYETVVHGGLQADLIAMGTSLYTGLHSVFSVGWLIHWDSSKVKKQAPPKMSKSHWLEVDCVCVNILKIH
jgi:hypothetical protein